MQTWKSMSLLIDGKAYKTHEPAMNTLTFTCQTMVHAYVSPLWDMKNIGKHIRWVRVSPNKIWL